MIFRFFTLFTGVEEFSVYVVDSSQNEISISKLKFKIYTNEEYTYSTIVIQHNSHSQ